MGHPWPRPVCVSPEEPEDAINIRNHILSAFEHASLESEAEQRASWLRFVIAGGGPTGVEMAGAFAELIDHVMQKDFPDIDFDNVEIYLVEAFDTLLAGFPGELQQAALTKLEQKGVVVQLGARLEGYDGEQIRLSEGRTIRSRSLIWAAGVEGQAVLGSMDVESTPDQRVCVSPTLQVAGYPNVYVIGDAAYLELDGKPLPMMAPVAVQMADHAASNILRQLAGVGVESFMYRDPGRLATIGRNAAVAEIRGIRFRGFLAWLVWLVVHLIQLVGFRNRMMVLINWAWEYLFYDRAVRLIIKQGEERERVGQVGP
jgi:NADH dehydrogenase